VLDTRTDESEGGGGERKGLVEVDKDLLAWHGGNIFFFKRSDPSQQIQPGRGRTEKERSNVLWEKEKKIQSICYMLTKKNSLLKGVTKTLTSPWSDTTQTKGQGRRYRSPRPQAGKSRWPEGKGFRMSKEGGIKRKGEGDGEVLGGGEKWIFLRRVERGTVLRLLERKSLTNDD